MFELEPCHYYERFSQCFAYYGRSIPKEITLLISYYVMLNIFAQKNVCHIVQKTTIILKR